MKIKFPPKRIVVPVDMSKPSLAALEAAKTLARSTGARLDIVYIQDLPLSLLGFSPEVEGPGRELAHQMEEFKAWRQERINRATRGLPPKSVRVRTIQGWPPRALADLAAGPGADLVLMGTHGYAGLNRAFFGSVAEAVVRRARVPVLTVHGDGKPLSLGKILVPFNGQAYAEKAVLCARAWANRFRARLTVLYVEPKDLHERQRTAAIESRVRKLLGPDARGASFKVRHGNAPHEILTEAERSHDLIVLAAHRRSFWSDFVLGSTAERVLRHSTVPVLSVPSVEKGGR